MANLDTTGIIKTDFTLEFTGLVKVLQDMHKKITQSSRLLTSLTEDFFQMRTTQDEMRIRNRDNFARVDSQKEATYERLVNIERLLEQLPDVYLSKTDFDTSRQTIMHEIQKQTDRIHEVEHCSGGKVAAAVEKHISRHLRNWYGPVREKESAELRAELNHMESKLEHTFFDELEKAESTLSTRIVETAKLASQELTEVSQDKDKQLASFRKLQSSDRQELQDMINNNDAAVKKIFNETNQQVDLRFGANETSCAALYYVLNLKEDDATHILKTREIEEQDDGDGEGPGEDRRVTLIHATLPYLEMRSKTQRDIRNRVKQSKEEDQDDFSKHIIELQRELKKKTDTARVMQMLHDNMDKGLYETVDFVKTKVALIEATKVNSDQFDEAMKSKCDVKVSEQKADRSFVNSLFEFLRNQFEQFQESQRAEVASVVENVVRTTYGGGSARPPPDPHQSATPQHENFVFNRPGDVDNLCITANTGFQYQQDSPSLRTVTAHSGAVDDALNPEADYQWASQTGQRQGMPPKKILKTPDASVRTSRSSDAKTRSWADDHAHAPPSQDPALPPLGSVGTDLVRGDQRRAQYTRGQDAYMKALQAQPTVSGILETSAPDVYVPESMRSHLVPHPPS